MKEGLKVILDCDPGNDDAWAIISLLRSEKKFGFKVIALTSVHGNTSVHHSAQNSLLILKTLNRLHDVPVYKGAETSLIINDGHFESFHGPDGFGMIYDDKPSEDLIQKKHAVDALRDHINEHPNNVTVIAIGPLTNIALLYKLNPGISAKIKNLYVMGGNNQGIGNISRCAEFNFWCDPEAAHIVFAESKCPIYVFPWEPCLDASNQIPFTDWRIKELSKNNNSFSQLLDPVEIKAYTKRGIEHRWCPCDNFLACCFIDPRMIEKMEKWHVTVELAGNHTRGQMILDHRKENEPNAFVIDKINIELFKKFMLWVCSHTSDYEI